MSIPEKDMVSNKLFFRSLKDMSAHTDPIEGSDCIPIDYVFNSKGYRCNEFSDQEILILGCSQTEGHGMPIELTWPHILSKKMNKDYINLAKGGDGMQGQITKAFQFFKEFYNPKYIFAVFPLTRLEVLSIKNDKNKGSLGVSIRRAMFSNDLVETFSKAPHRAESVFPEEFAIFYNILFIKMLSQYCETNNIKLLWTYYMDTSIEIPSFENLIAGYFDADYINRRIEEKCHSEFADNILFEHAADSKSFPPGHWGSHHHMHIADHIYNML